MRNYDLTVENGEITWIDCFNDYGETIPGILYIPENATAFSPDAWIHLGCDIDGIVVHEDNPAFSSAHNCLLSKDGRSLLKVCKNSDLSKLTDLKTIGSSAFATNGADLDVFKLRIPDGVELLAYRALAMSAQNVEITVPASVKFVDLMAFMIHSQHTHIIFEGDTQLRIGTFGTAAEAKDSDFDLYRSMPECVYIKAENLSVTCVPGSRVSEYCRTYGIPEV